MDCETIEVTHNYSAIISSIMVVNKEDLGAFTTPCTNKVYKFGKILCDLGECIKLMLLSVF